MDSFAAAWRSGAGGIELDIRLTRDRELVVFHDADGQRLAGIPGAIEAVDWREIETWRVQGSSIPRLVDVLDAAPEGSLTLVEIKSGLSTIPVLAPVLARSRGSHVGILSFNREVVAMSRRCFPRHPVLLNMEADDVARLDDLIPFAVAEQLTGLSIGWSSKLNTDVVSAIKKSGLECAVWTVNDPEHAVAAQRMGVDLLMTDDPAAIIAGVQRG